MPIDLLFCTNHLITLDQVGNLHLLAAIHLYQKSLLAAGVKGPSSGRSIVTPMNLASFSTLLAACTLQFSSFGMVFELDPLPT